MSNNKQQNTIKVHSKSNHIKHTASYIKQIFIDNTHRIEIYTLYHNETRHVLLLSETLHSFHQNTFLLFVHTLHSNYDISIQIHCSLKDVFHHHPHCSLPHRTQFPNPDPSAHSQSASPIQPHSVH